MEISKIHKWEKAVSMILNVMGWDLEWVGGQYAYDAKGFTPKKKSCIIEYKFRDKYYEEKLLEAKKYKALMETPDIDVRLYFINDQKGNYMYWLGDLQMPNSVKLYLPDTSLWTKKRLKKEVYLLKENDASIINLNNY